MKRLLLTALLVLPAAGCGSDKADNSKIQSPNDQPIGFAPSNDPNAKPQLKGKSLPLDPAKK